MPVRPARHGGTGSQGDDGKRRYRGKLLPAGEHERLRADLFGTVARGASLYCNFVAGGEGIAGPTDALEFDAALHLTGPILNLALRAGDIDEDEHVRIGPIVLGDDAFERDRLLIVIGRRHRMMR